MGDDVRARVRERLVRMWRVAPFGAALLTGLVAHVGIAPHLAVRGAAPDVLLVAVVAVAVRWGSRTGAGFGFAAGLGADVFLATPLGTSALAYTLVGHVLGRSRRSRRAAARRAAIRRSFLLTARGVAAGRLATVVVATTLGGVPFPGMPGLIRIAGVAVLSAPLGLLVGVAVRRLDHPNGGRG